MKFTRFTTIAALVVVPLMMTACSQDADTASDSSVALTEGVMVTNQWARTSPMATTMGAVYFTLNSVKDDVLTDVMVDGAVASAAQIHETVMATADSTMMGSGSTAAPAMTMQEVAEVALPAGEDVAFAPGGYHVMLMMLKSPLKVGTDIKVTLVFKNAPEQVVTVPVLDEAP